MNTTQPNSLTSLKLRQRKIYLLYAAFIVGGFSLFLALTWLVDNPRIERSFNSAIQEKEKQTAQTLAEKLSEYIRVNKLALTDIASTSTLTRSVLLADGSDPTFLDYITHALLLGVDPDFTVVDAFGGVIFSESEATPNVAWVQPVIDGERDSLVQLKTDNTLLVAVPIIYGAQTEGALIAEISGDPDLIFSNTLLSEVGQNFRIEKNGIAIESSGSSIENKNQYPVVIEAYGILFTYRTDKSELTSSVNELTADTFISRFVSGVGLFALLFFLGRQILILPFQSLVESEQAISSAVEGISKVKANGYFASSNSSFNEILKTNSESLTQKHWLSIFLMSDRPKAEKAFETALQKQKSEFEAQGVRGDGSTVFLRVSLVSHPKSQPSEAGFYCFIQDISERKENEEKIRAQQQDLQLIFDNVPARIWYKDDKNRILKLNQRAAESMGGSVLDFEGQDTFDLFPDMAKKYHEDDLQVIKSNKPVYGIVEKYTPLNGPHGWVSTDKIPFIDPVTQQASLLVCARDITDLKNAELQKNRLINELSQTNADLEQFAHVAAHDLKAPLRGIEQLAGWIREDCADILPEQSSKHLNLMSDRVNRMRTLLDDLLEYANVRHLDLEKEAVFPKLLLQDLGDLRVEPFGFYYMVDAPEQEIFIARRPFEMVIRNLLDNAIKHHDKLVGTVKVNFMLAKDAYIIKVADDGPGIPKVMQEKVFEMFQTLQPRDEKSGSGTGLALIKKILERYNGQITVESNGIRGTTFTVIWPFEPVSDD